MKKRLALLLVLAMTAGMTACGSNSSSDSKEQDSASSKDQTTMTIMFSGTGSDSYTQGERDLVEQFNKENSYGVTLEPEFLSTSDYKTKLATMMASGSAPDIFFTYELSFLENYVNGNKVQSLQKYLDEDEAWTSAFNEGTLDQLSYNGECYGVPMSQCLAVMYYNTEIFDQYNLSVPTTYEEYCNICDTLLENNVTPVALASTSDDAWLVSQYIQQLSDGIAGYDLFDSLKNGTGKWNDDAFIQAATLFQQEVDNGYFEQGFTGVGNDEARAIFQNGQAAMYFNGTWEVPNLDSEECSVSGKVDCFTMPALNSENAGVSVGALNGSFAISSQCKNVDAAVDFLKLLTSKEWEEKWLYEYGMLPSTNIEVDTAKVTPLCQSVIDCMASCQSLTPWFDRLNTDLGNEFNNCGVAISNGDNPQETYDNLQEYAESR